MSTSTRESMRIEFKELAKLAETMGKTPPVESAQAAEPPEATRSQGAIERPSTPPSMSAITVPPPRPSISSPVFLQPPPKRSRAGLLAVLVGAGLAIALVGGALLGRSYAARMPSGSGVNVAAAAPQPLAPAVAEVPSAPAAASPEPVIAAPIAAASVTPPAATPKATPSPAKHHARAHSVRASAKAVAEGPSGAPDGEAASIPRVTAKASAKPAYLKSSAVKSAPPASGGSSLEDLIRQEVAAQKK